jgi:hypothetical protein
MSDGNTGRPAEDPRVAVARKNLAEYDALDVAEMTSMEVAEWMGCLAGTTRGLLVYIDEKEQR